LFRMENHKFFITSSLTPTGALCILSPLPRRCPVVARRAETTGFMSLTFRLTLTSLYSKPSRNGRPFLFAWNGRPISHDAWVRRRGWRAATDMRGPDGGRADVGRADVGRADVGRADGANRPLPSPGARAVSRSQAGSCSPLDRELP